MGDKSYFLNSSLTRGVKRRPLMGEQGCMGKFGRDDLF